MSLLRKKAESQMQTIRSSCESMKKALSLLLKGNYSLQVIENTYASLLEQFKTFESILKQTEIALEDEQISLSADMLMKDKKKRKDEKREKDLIDRKTEHTLAKKAYETTKPFFEEVEELIKKQHSLKID